MYLLSHLHIKYHTLCTLETSVIAFTLCHKNGEIFFCWRKIIRDSEMVLITVHELRQIDLLLKGSLAIRVNFPSTEEAATLKTHQMRVFEFNNRNAHMIIDKVQLATKNESANSRDIKSMYIGM